MSRAEFTLRLKTLAEAGKAVGHDKFPLVVLFDSDVWGGRKGIRYLKTFVIMEWCSCFTEKRQEKNEPYN